MSKSKLKSFHRPMRALGSCALVFCLLAGSAWAEPWKFALLGDARGPKSGEGSTNGVRVSVLRPLAEDIARQKVKLVLFSGDLASGGVKIGPLAVQWTAWREAMAPLYQAGIAVYPCRGNHEIRKGATNENTTAEWRAFLPDLPTNGPAGQEGLTYRIDAPDATIIGVDEYAGRSKTFSGTNYDDVINFGMVSPWVVDEVYKATTPWVFVFSHEAAWMGHHTDGLVNAPAERDALWDALGAKGGIYLAGHDHLYVRRTAPDSFRRPVLEIVAGCAGAPPYPYDHAALNARWDRHLVPTELFINASIAKDAKPDPTAERKPNTNGHPNYFGYVLFTIDGAKMTGEWRALTNYNLKKWKVEGTPEFSTLDTFSQESGRAKAAR